MPPKGYKKAIAENALPDSLQVQELMQEIADLKREAAERPAAIAPVTTAQDTNAALLAFLTAGAISTKPLDYKLTLNKPYTFTDERKEAIEAMMRPYAEKGLEWLWDKNSPSVTFRKQATIRTFDAELNMWVKAKIWVSESLHASTSDQSFKHRIKELCSVK